MFAWTTVVCLCIAVAAASVPETLGQWQRFKQLYDRQYTTEEEPARYQNFVANMQRAAELAKQNPLAKFGVTKFSDLTQDEFRAQYANGREYYARRLSEKRLVTPAPTATPVPLAPIDWVQKGKVTAVKNQGQCGSCWAFSAVSNIESLHAIGGHKLMNCSVQEIVSCDTNDNGCNGGLMDNAFEWLLKYQEGKLITDLSFPYVSGDGSVPPCNIANKPVCAIISGYHDLPNDEVAMNEFLHKTGPISAAIDATSWQLYQGGIMTACNGQQVDHGTNIIGFGVENGQNYWRLQNMWGADWGEHGFIRLAYGTNQCLINSYPTTAEMKW